MSLESCLENQCWGEDTITMWGTLATQRGSGSLVPLSTAREMCPAANKKHTHTPPGLSLLSMVSPARQIRCPSPALTPCSDRQALRAGFVPEPGMISSGNTPVQQVPCTQGCFQRGNNFLLL